MGDETETREGRVIVARSESDQASWERACEEHRARVAQAEADAQPRRELAGHELATAMGVVAPGGQDFGSRMAALEL